MRDPRIDPIPGDRLRAKSGQERYVEFRDGYDIRYWYPTATGEPGILRACWITTWQDWCRKNDARPVETAPKGDA